MVLVIQNTEVERQIGGSRTLSLPPPRRDHKETSEPITRLLFRQETESCWSIYHRYLLNNCLMTTDLYDQQFDICVGSAGL